MYDDLSNEQWVPGFLFCVIEEQDQMIKNRPNQHPPQNSQ